MRENTCVICDNTGQSFGGECLMCAPEWQETLDIRPVFIFRTDTDGKEKSQYIVKEVRYFDWSGYSSEWMCDDQLGDSCLVPDVDITEKSYTFDTEQEALRKVAELYAAQLSD